MMQHVNLREVFAAFQELYAPARDLVGGGQWLAEPGQELKGAPLRCSLEGARLEAPGVLVTGEAAGSTYAFTGEGIGKAMETAMHAAEAILARPRDDAGDGADAAIRADYAARVLSLKPRFDLYEEANRANAHPWLIDLLVWSAKRSPRRLQRMAGVLEETHIPTDAAPCAASCGACSTGADDAVLPRSADARVSIGPVLRRHPDERAPALVPRKEIMEYMLLFYQPASDFARSRRSGQGGRLHGGLDGVCPGGAGGRHRQERCRPAAAGDGTTLRIERRPAPGPGRPVRRRQGAARRLLHHRRARPRHRARPGRRARRARRPAGSRCGRRLPPRAA